MAEAFGVNHPSTKSADARLEIRLNESIKQEVESAAAIQGVSVSAFVTSTVLEAARRIRSAHEATVMEDEERDAFLELIRNPPTASEQLVKLMGTKAVL